MLGASFARLDLPFAGLLRQVVPVAPVHSTPRALLNALLMGGRGSRLQLLRLRAAINGIPANVLRTRAKAALTVDLPAEQLAVDQPLLYLRARRDRLMPASAEQTVRAVAKHSQAIAIDGPHFLFEFEPDACAREIAGFLARVGLR